MNRSVISLFETMENKLSGYVAVASYRYMNLCVKAEEVSLLSVRVDIQGEEKRIEEIAQVSKKDEYQFMAVPNYSGDMLALSEGIALQHPEFKQDFGTETVNVKDKEGIPHDVKVKYLLLTMPEVDDERYDLLKTAVNAAYNQCKADMEAVVADAKAQIMPLMAGEEIGDIRRVKEGIEKSEKTWTDHRENFYHAKIKEIEEAHDKWKYGQLEESLKNIRNKGGNA